MADKTVRGHVLAELRGACLQKFTHDPHGYYADRLATGDAGAVRVGALVGEVAARVRLTHGMTRNALLRLEKEGRVIASRTGTAHRWWPVGLAAEILANGS